MTELQEVQPPPDLRAFVSAHAAFVWRSLRFLGVSPSDLPDVSQEVFLVVLRKLDSFEGRSSQRSWLYGICIHSARAYRRRAHRRYELPSEQVPEEVTHATPEAAFGLREKQELLSWALDRVDDDAREVFVLVGIEQVAAKDVAEATGCALNTVYDRLHSARRQIQQALRQRALSEVKL